MSKNLEATPNRGNLALVLGFVALILGFAGAVQPDLGIAGPVAGIVLGLVAWRFAVRAGGGAGTILAVLAIALGVLRIVQLLIVVFLLDGYLTSTEPHHVEMPANPQSKPHVVPAPKP
jgi:hypothetical protein